MNAPLSNFTRNLRYQLWRRGVAREQWVLQLTEWLDCGERRAWQLLRGDQPHQEELRHLAERMKMKEETLQSDELVEQVQVLTENLRCLLDAPKRGGKKVLAEELGVQQASISRWLRGGRPEPRHQAAIKKYFGLPANVDLETDPLFLELSPVGSYAQRAWLRQHADELDEETLRVLFPALERLLR